MFAAAVAVALGAAACGDSSSAPTPASKPAPPQTTSAAPAAPNPGHDAPRSPPRAGWQPLPEDPAAGKQSEEQWRAHLEHEDEERQMWFDLSRRAEYRTLLKQVATARAQYERVRKPADVERTRVRLQAKIGELQERVRQIDPVGNSSRAVPDLQALLAVLTGPYGDAKRAALEGDAQALARQRAAFDQRLARVDEWLEEAEREAKREGHVERAEDDEDRESEERAEEARRERSEKLVRVPADRDQP